MDSHDPKFRPTLDLQEGEVGVIDLLNDRTNSMVFEAGKRIRVKLTNHKLWDGSEKYTLSNSLCVSINFSRRFGTKSTSFVLRTPWSLSDRSASFNILFYGELGVNNNNHLHRCVCVCVNHLSRQLINLFLLSIFPFVFVFIVVLI